MNYIKYKKLNYSIQSIAFTIGLQEFFKLNGIVLAITALISTLIYINLIKRNETTLDGTLVALTSSLVLTYLLTRIHILAYCWILLFSILFFATETSIFAINLIPGTQQALEKLIEPKKSIKENYFKKNSIVDIVVCISFAIICGSIVSWMIHHSSLCRLPQIVEKEILKIDSNHCSD